MDPDIFLRDVVDPPLTKLGGWTGKTSDTRARVLVMTIAGQETLWKQRRQVGGGEARSFWQFERGGGVAGLLNTPSTKIDRVCAALDIPVNSADIFEAMAWNDTLACCMARLLLWTDPRPLPELGYANEAWHYYLDIWRPGLPRPATWSARYSTAMALVTGEGL